jgi:hypothetical protein
VYPCEFECKTSAKTSELEVQEYDSDTISISTHLSRVTWSMMRLPCDYRSLDYIPPPDPFTPAQRRAAILKLISHQRNEALNYGRKSHQGAKAGCPYFA